MNNDDQPAHVEVPLPIAANQAVNLLTMPLEEQQEADLHPEEEAFKKKRQALKEDIYYMISEYQAQSQALNGRIQELEQCLEKVSLEEDNTKDVFEKPLVAMKKELARMQDTYAHLCEYCGAKTERQVPQTDMANMDTLTIANGRLIADVAANSGVVAYVTK